MPVAAPRSGQRFYRLRSKMTPITLITNRLHLHNFRFWLRPDNLSPVALADLLIGNSLLITDITFILDPGSKHGFTQYWQWNRPRVEESRLWEKSFPEATPPLGEFLAKAIFDWVFVKNHAQMLAYLRGRNESLELSTFEPESWQDKSLSITINAIRAFSFECRIYGCPKPQATDEVSCQLRIDKHLTFFDVPIYSEEKGWFFNEPRIQVPSVNQPILDLLRNRALRERARDILKGRSTVDLSHVTYLYCVPGYQPDGPPSPITLI